jgi:hypothetical protein
LEGGAGGIGNGRVNSGGPGLFSDPAKVRREPESGPLGLLRQGASLTRFLLASPAAEK